MADSQKWTARCQLEGCDRPVARAGRGRPKKFCTDAHRKAHSRLNGHENRSDRQSPMRGEYADFGPPQPVDTIQRVCPFNQELEPILRRARSAKDHFEEYPCRQKKSDSCITYKLTDGKQINTGYGRTSRPLGYVIEISDGRWVSRVGDLSSEPLPLGAAKKAAMELCRSRARIESRQLDTRPQSRGCDGDRPNCAPLFQRQARSWLTRLEDGAYMVRALLSGQTDALFVIEHTDDPECATAVEFLSHGVTGRCYLLSTETAWPMSIFDIEECAARNGHSFPS